MTLIAYVLSKLRTPKDAVKEISKKCRFSLRFDKQHRKRTQTLFKSSEPRLYHNYRSVRRISSLKK